MLRIQRLAHIGLLVTDLTRARYFYETLFGLTPNPLRPDFENTGVWYDLEDGCQIHLMYTNKPTTEKSTAHYGGWTQHVAFSIQNLQKAEAALKQFGVPYDMSTSGRPALFCRDPDGNTLEISAIQPEALLVPKDPPLPLFIHVSIQEQRLSLLDANENLLFDFPVSTAKNGVGESENSECTPRGAHYVYGKFGYGEPLQSVFRARRATGEVWTPELAKQFPDRDWVLTRILWLSGTQPHINCFGNVDSRKRFIYIHGTPPDQQLGVPASHGCIRMDNQDVLTLFDKVPVGTPVYIQE